MINQPLKEVILWLFLKLNNTRLLEVGKPVYQSCFDRESGGPRFSDVL